jgi:NADH dehydrogenase FAD-containing subunit
VRTIPGITYYQAWARRLDLEGKRVVCEEVFINESFEVPYDVLVVAVGQ